MGFLTISDFRKSDFFRLGKSAGPFFVFFGLFLTPKKTPIFGLFWGGGGEAHFWPIFDHFWPILGGTPSPPQQNPVSGVRTAY